MSRRDWLDFGIAGAVSYAGFAVIVDGSNKWVAAGFATAIVMYLLGAFLYIATKATRRIDELKHLANAYRAELGEPPLYPEIECWQCNPAPVESSKAGEAP